MSAVDALIVMHFFVLTSKLILGGGGVRNMGVHDAHSIPIPPFGNKLAAGITFPP